MGVYIAPEIKDRVAVGDDLYTITDSGGKKKLTPSPTEVAEPGTEINKALLAPAFKTIQRLDSDIIPYNNYWWRIKQSGGSYSMKLVPGSQISEAYYTRVTNSGTLNYVEFTNTTLQIASSIKMSTSGVISLVNPTSLTINLDSISSDRDAIAEAISGKYVKGLCRNGYICKVDSAVSSSYLIDDYTYSSDGGETYQTIWYLPVDYMQVATADYVSVTSDFSYVSNEDENFYPHSGTHDGIEYQYLGKIFDVAVKAEPYGIKIVNITSASWTNGNYTIAMPHSRYMLWSGEGVSLLVNDGMAYGSYTDYQSYSYDQQTNFASGATTVVVGDHKAESAAYTLTFTTSNITVAQGRSSSLTLAYLPL